MGGAQPNLCHQKGSAYAMYAELKKSFLNNSTLVLCFSVIIQDHALSCFHTAVALRMASELHLGTAHPCLLLYVKVLFSKASKYSNQKR